MILVQLHMNEQSTKIYNLTQLDYFRIAVEPKHSHPLANQCHRCQKFGHGQMSCKANPKCVNCAGDHLSTDCTKPLHTPPKCCNCSGAHPASFLGCPRYPKPTNETNKQRQNQITNHHQPNTPKWSNGP